MTKSAVSRKLWICSHLLKESLRIHWRLSRILKTNNKSVWSNVFWYVCSECVFNTLYIEIKHKSWRKFPSNEINGTKNDLFFLSRAPTHQSFIFNLQFLYKLKHKVRLSKTVCGIFHFRFRFVFYFKVYLFVQQNTWSLWF